MNVLFLFLSESKSVCNWHGICSKYLTIWASSNSDGKRGRKVKILRVKAKLNVKTEFRKLLRRLVINITNILRAPFCIQKCYSQLFCTYSLCWYFLVNKGNWQKAARKKWLNWLLILASNATLYPFFASTSFVEFFRVTPTFHVSKISGLKPCLCVLRPYF